MYMTRRVVQLIGGLWLFGASIALMLRAGLGLDPWDVLHQGISVRTHVPIAGVVVAVSVLVLLWWIPLHQRPGIGTLANVVLVGIFLDVTMGLLPIPSTLWWQVLFLVTGVIANGAATGLYIGAALGPGARDGLMTGLAARGVSVRLARTAIEVAALGIGWLLGGSIGIGTVVYAVTIGPLAHLFIPLFATTDHPEKHHDANVARSRH